MEASYKRFKQSNPGQQYPSEFDFSTAMLDDLKSRNVAPVYVLTLDLSVAGSQMIPVPGRSFVPYFFVTASAQQTRALNGLITAYPNQDDASNNFFGLPAAHNRGFIGSFSKLFITWTAQPGISVNLVFHRSSLTPWMTDDFVFSSANAPSSTITANGSQVIAQLQGNILLTATGTITLPNPALWTGEFTVKTGSAAVVATVQCAVGNIDSVATDVFTNLDAHSYFSDGVNAWIK